MGGARHRGGLGLHGPSSRRAPAVTGVMPARDVSDDYRMATPARRVIAGYGPCYSRAKIVPDAPSFCVAAPCRRQASGEEGVALSLARKEREQRGLLRGEHALLGDDAASPARRASRRRRDWPRPSVSGAIAIEAGRPAPSRPRTMRSSSPPRSSMGMPDDRVVDLPVDGGRGHGDVERDVVRRARRAP